MSASDPAGAVSDDISNGTHLPHKISHSRAPCNSSYNPAPHGQHPTKYKPAQQGWDNEEVTSSLDDHDLRIRGGDEQTCRDTPNQFQHRKPIHKNPPAIAVHVAAPAAMNGYDNRMIVAQMRNREPIIVYLASPSVPSIKQIGLLGELQGVLTSLNH